MRVRSKLEEKPSSLKCGATNAKIKTAFVEYSTHESIKKRCTQHQSKSYTHSTRSLFDWYVWFLSMVGFSIPRTFTLRSILPTPVILREAEGEVAESIFQQITLVIRVKGDHWRNWLRARQKHFLIPLIRPDWQLSPWVKVFLRFLKCGFCNSGQALRAEWHESEVAEWEKKPNH